MYLEAEEQGGKTWLSLVKTEPTFLSHAEAQTVAVAEQS